MVDDGKPPLVVPEAPAARDVRHAGDEEETLVFESGEELRASLEGESKPRCVAPSTPSTRRIQRCLSSSTARIPGIFIFAPSEGIRARCEDKVRYGKFRRGASGADQLPSVPGGRQDRFANLAPPWSRCPSVWPPGEEAFGFLPWRPRPLLGRAPTRGLGAALWSPRVASRLRLFPATGK